MIDWCPFCSAPVRSLITADGRGFCTWGHGLVWPGGLSAGAASEKEPLVETRSVDKAEAHHAVAPAERPFQPDWKKGKR